MSQRDDAVPVRHMLEHAREALSLVTGRTREELHSHRMLQLALTRLVEIVGSRPCRGARPSPLATESPTVMTWSTTTSCGTRS